MVTPTRRVAFYITVIAVAICGLSLVLISPLLLTWVGRVNGIDWTRLSYIGQTYGATSAILSAVALLGVSLSLLVQARQARTERIRIVRDRHMDLLRLVLEEPDIYYPVIGAQKRSALANRRHLFATMWMNYARTGYQMKIFSEEDLRQDILGPAFEGEPARMWWCNARRYWDYLAKSDRPERKFIEIMDDEYRKALKAGPPVMLHEKDRSGDDNRTAMLAASDRRGFVCGAIVGVVIGIAFGSRKRLRRS